MLIEPFLLGAEIEVFAECAEYPDPFVLGPGSQPVRAARLARLEGNTAHNFGVTVGVGKKYCYPELVPNAPQAYGNGEGRNHDRSHAGDRDQLG